MKMWFISVAMILLSVWGIIRTYERLSSDAKAMIDFAFWAWVLYKGFDLLSKLGV